MSDKNHDSSISDHPTDGDDLAIDSLLREHAHNEGADTDFLSALDDRLDQVDAGQNDSATDAQTAPTEQKKIRSFPILIAAGMAIAACLPAMLLIQGRFGATADKAGYAVAETEKLNAIHVDFEKDGFDASGSISKKQVVRQSDPMSGAVGDASVAAAPAPSGSPTRFRTETREKFLAQVDNTWHTKNEAPQDPTATEGTNRLFSAKPQELQRLGVDGGVIARAATEVDSTPGASAPTPAPVVPKPALAVASPMSRGGAVASSSPAKAASAATAGEGYSREALLSKATTKAKRTSYYDQSLNESETLSDDLARGTEKSKPDAAGQIAGFGLETRFAGRVRVETPSQEAYGELKDNVFKTALQHPLSTFSIDVDTASYSNLRRMITDGQKVPAGAVRIEEMINYFSYDYPKPEGEHPFAVDLEVGPSPWAEGNRLVRVGLKGVEVDEETRPSANLVFLLDVSGSMNSHDKLPLVKKAMSTLVEGIAGDDTVGIVVYAGREGIALPPTDGGRKNQILKAIQSLSSGGSTNGEAGIKLAYRLAEKQFVKGGINRVVLCTDGDFNVGTSGTDELTDLVKKKAKTGVYLSVCGFGSGNLNDAMLESITNDGNGNYFYIDSAKEAEKVFCKDLTGTLITIAKDVKIQVEFNPAQVENYRLIGYANRMLRNRDFEDDKIDAGDIGSGHNVTALYEITPKGARPNVPAGTTLRYQNQAEVAEDPVVAPGEEVSPDLLTVKLRYKQPAGKTSTLLEVPLVDEGTELDETSDDFRHASAVAGFGMLLRDSDFAPDLDRDMVLELAKSAKGKDKDGRRKEFLKLVREAKL